MPTYSYISLEGWHVVETTFEDCECFVSKGYNPITGSIELLKAQICGKCYDEAICQLDQRATGRNDQLTLGLASPRATGGEDNG